MKNYFLSILLFCAYIVQAQVVFPYVEVEKDDDFRSLSIENLTVESSVQMVLGTVVSEQVFTNTSNHALALRYVVPLVGNQNLYALTIENDEEKIEFQAETLSNVRRALQKNNQTISALADQSELMTVDLSDLPAGKQLKIRIKWTKIVEKNRQDYAFLLSSPIVKRTKNFTITKRFQFDKKDYLPENFRYQINLVGENGQLSHSLPTHFQTIKSVNHPTKTYISSVFFDQTINLSYHYFTAEMQANLLRFDDGECSYFLGNIVPPAKIEQEKLKPREYIFLLDTSGSMRGFALDGMKKMMLSVIEKLKESEKFNIYYFNKHSNQLAVRSVFATKENIKKAKEMLQNLEGSGNMKLNEALKRVHQIPVDYSFNRLVVIASDGRLDPNQNIHLDIKSNLKNAQYFVLGIGEVVDKKNMNYLGYTTGISPLIIESSENIDAKLKAFESLILTPLLRNIEVQSKSINLEETFPKNFNGFLSNQPINFVTKSCHLPKNARLSITGKDGDFAYAKEFSDLESTSTFGEAIKYYWLYNKVKSLMLEEERCGEYCRKTGRYRKEIEQLGKEYNVATPYTVLVENSSDRKDIIRFHYDYDSDGDGVNDLVDRCPDEAGTRETFGCPMQKLAEGEKQKALEKLANNLVGSVKFDFDQAIIRVEDFDFLNKLAKLLLDYPTENFLIEGHTDAAGTENYNLSLSEKRAFAVAQYLEKKGIDFSRMQVTGIGTSAMKYPECRPVEMCAEWKNFENRRVVIKIRPSKEN